MTYNDVLFQKHLHKGTHDISLSNIYPIDIDCKHIKDVVRMIGEDVSHNQYADHIQFTLEDSSNVIIRVTEGMVAKKDEVMNEKFFPKHLWSGGDGIFSFQLNGQDDMDQTHLDKTLFVFGDTFVGESDPKTHQRLAPTLMPNNSLAYMKNNEISFHLQKGTYGEIKSFFEIDPNLNVKGTVPNHLLKNDQEMYLGQGREVTLTYRFHKKRVIDHVLVGNYVDASSLLMNRSVTTMTIHSVDDEKQIKVSLAKARDDKDVQTFEMSCHTQSIQITLIHDGASPLIGLRYLVFGNQDKIYEDAIVTASSIYSLDPAHAWLWLQDGIVLDQKFYFIPMKVIPDQTQPEGLQFKVIDTMLFEVPIQNQSLDFEAMKQKDVALLKTANGITRMMGAAMMNAIADDGYVYIYGYIQTYGLRELIVARVKDYEFDDIDAWMYYCDGHWTYEMNQATPILAHISCEMSVSKILSGPLKDKYIAVFTYDTDRPYVAFAIGESPYGPFDEPQKIYHTPEQDTFKSTTYTYNAKAHPHLSKSNDILVSYNTNTYNYDHNMSHAHIYRPRFIRLSYVTKEMT